MPLNDLDARSFDPRLCFNPCWRLLEREASVRDIAGRAFRIRVLGAGDFSIAVPQLAHDGGVGIVEHVEGRHRIAVYDVKEECDDDAGRKPQSPTSSPVMLLSGSAYS